MVSCSLLSLAAAIDQTHLSTYFYTGRHEQSMQLGALSSVSMSDVTSS